MTQNIVVTIGRLLFPLDYPDGKKLNYMVYGLIIMGAEFNEIGFIRLPRGYKVIGIDSQSNLILYNFLDDNPDGIRHFLRSKISDNYTVRKGFAEIPQEYLFSTLEDDYNSYFNSINPQLNSYKNIVIVPADNTCPSCVNKLCTFLDMMDSTNKDIAFVIAFKYVMSYPDFSKKYTFDNIKGRIYYDYEKIYLDKISIPNRNSLFEKSEQGFKLQKSYEISELDKLMDFISPTSNKVGPACNTK